MLPQNVDSEWKTIRQQPNVIYQDKAYVLVQLTGIPSSKEKATLKAQGIELLHYIPHYAWFAKIDLQVDAQTLLNHKIRAVSPFQANWKLSKDMQQAYIPPHVGQVNLMAVRILFWKNTTAIDYAQLCEKAGFTIENQNDQWAWVEVNGSWKQCLDFAKHPLVQHIEWIEKPTELEFRDEVTLIQSNYISNNPGQGLFFNGAGVDIAVNEGGIVDSAHSANFKGRLDRSLESGNASGHKTGVGRRMASAGNLNPNFRGTAFGANLHSGGINFSDAATNGISIVNNSFGWGCIGASTTSTYNSGAETNDNLVRNNPSFMITYSCGNNGGSDCGYGGGTAGAGWGNITGLTKSAKNIFAVGSLNPAGELTGFSSRGPAWDGRILPDICATGPGGTSHASPNLAGVFAQLTQAYRSHNNGSTPNSGLLKAIIMNSAEDIENPGPDFKTGYGKINARKAYNIIANNQFMTDSIAQGGLNMHNITVLGNVKEVKVMAYWTDYEAVAGITSRALVNDLDMTLVAPNAQVWQPWVLNPTADSAILELPAVRATDTLNNVEQVTLLNPIPGTYTVQIDGSMVPQGPQRYFIVYELIYDDLFVTYPLGGEHFVAGSTERIRWDSQGDTGTFDLSYSLDNGTSWNSIASNLSSDTRFYDWNVPNNYSNTALVRVQRNGLTAVSDTTFDILAQVQNLNIVWTCNDSSLLTWDSIPNVDGYVIYKLGSQYMDSIGFSTNNSYILNSLSTSDAEYLAVAAVKNNTAGRRSIAIERNPTNLNCTLYDLGVLNIVNPNTNVLPACVVGSNLTIEVDVQNWGVNGVNYIPLAYSINGGTPVLDTILINLATGMNSPISFSTSISLPVGNHSLDIWTQYPSDGNISNDTLRDSLFIYNGMSSTLPLTESFDNFNTCSTAWGCESISCTLSSGWYNLTNTQGDEIDWRTDDNGTGTGGTGPDADHTTGNGNYLYLEGSGNNGGGCQNNVAILHSPCIDLTFANQPHMSLWYHAHGGSIGSLHIDAIANGTLYEDIIPFVNGPQGNAWDSLSVDLSPFIGQEVVIAIRGYTGGGYQADLAIDDININSLPYVDFNLPNSACTGSTVSFTNNSAFATSYQWTITGGNFTYLNNTNSSSANPDIQFIDPGYYSIQLVATNSTGMDSMTLNNIIQVGNYPNTTVTQNGLSLSVNTTNATYQWVDCNANYNPILGATSQSFTPQGNGDFAVIVTENGCTDTSSCHNITSVGLTTVHNSANFKFYPNPTNGALTIDLGMKQEEALISISNVLGQVVYEAQYSNQQIVQLELEGIPAVYFVTVRTKNKDNITVKILKE